MANSRCLEIWGCYEKRARTADLGPPRNVVVVVLAVSIPNIPHIPSLSPYLLAFGVFPARARPRQREADSGKRRPAEKG